MPTTDQRVDSYIDKAPDYAKPILTAVRAMVHEAAPDCEETLKWGHPSFTQGGILCGMAAFKEYCAVNFWKSALIIEGAKQDGWYGVFGKIKTVSDLPPKTTFVGYVKRAVELNESGEKVSRPAPKPKKPLSTPDDLRRALAKNAKARQAFKTFSPSQKREYVEWIIDAKQDATRTRRIAQAVGWIAEGKPRNWKYMK